MVFIKFIQVALYMLAMLPILTLFTATFFPYSYTHPSYPEFKTKIEAINENKGLDFSNLNNGRWKTACLFGGYSNPSYMMDEYGKIGWVDTFYQPMKALPIVRLAQVEEHEAIIAYVDRSNQVSFIHFKSGRNKSGRSLEYVSKCTSRTHPILYVFRD